MKGQFTHFSRNQFLSALTYIRRDKSSSAVTFRNKAETILRRLEMFPASERVIPEFPELPYREVIVSPYRFFYKVKDNIVWIIAMWHGAQYPKEPKA
jgi:toxin ParE1/3/4